MKRRNDGDEILLDHKFVLLALGMTVAEVDQTYGGFFDILRGGTERFLTNIKDTSSKVIQSVAK